MFIRVFSRFNTTFVTVLSFCAFLLSTKNVCFNTTFVTVLSTNSPSFPKATQCFNTTFVTVLLYRKLNSEKGGRVSIQLLLLFYRDRKRFSSLQSMFQYNFCYCSMVNGLAVNCYCDCFNTTFVTVL